MLVELRRPWLQQHGFRSVIDVGANEGQFALLARTAFPLAQILSFEPLPDCYEQLRARFKNDTRFGSLPFAIGASDGELIMHRNAYSQSSSILPMGEAHREAFPFTAETKQITVQIRSLDSLPEVQALPLPLFLKIDVQGYEKEVLRGALLTLTRTAMVMLEVSLTELYHFEPLLDDILPTMRSAGFYMSGIAGMTRRPRDDRQLQIDAIFERA
jgi:FkbM family methyltransferase